MAGSAAAEPFTCAIWSEEAASGTLDARSVLGGAYPAEQCTNGHPRGEPTIMSGARDRDGS
jgi:hypothetical protein